MAYRRRGIPKREQITGCTSKRAGVYRWNQSAQHIVLRWVVSQIARQFLGVLMFYLFSGARTMRSTDTDTGHL